MRGLPGVLIMSLVAKQGRLNGLFRQWDTDGNGRVEREEMLAALSAEGVLDLDDVDTMSSLWRVFDPEGEGSVDFRSLKRTLQKVATQQRLASEQEKSAALFAPDRGSSPAPKRCAIQKLERSGREPRNLQPPRRDSCTAGSARRRSSCAMGGQHS